MTISIARPSAKEAPSARGATTRADSKGFLASTKHSADVSSESRRLHSAKEIEDLLQQLANVNTSREEREKLHSRLLAGLSDMTAIDNMTYKLVRSPQARQDAEYGPQSRFSDFSDDEDEGDTSAEASTSYYRSREGDRVTLIARASAPATKEPSATTTVFDIDL